MGNNNLISSKKTYYISIAILAGMFFIFGFVSWVNAILIPYFRISCELTHFESYFVAFAFYIAYFVMAIPSGVLLKKVGFKRGIMYGFMLTALGAFLFVPAALARQFEIFLAGLFSIGTGESLEELKKKIAELLAQKPHTPAEIAEKIEAEKERVSEVIQYSLEEGEWKMQDGMIHISK